MSDIRLQLGVAISMRDGVRLSANLYRPPGKGPFVTVLQLTPYTADSIHPWASYFAASGFAFLAVNCRGRGGSSGKFRPFEDDARDGHDAVEWAAKQPWCDGRVVMSGGSYAGFTQWATASQRPKGLTAIAPIASAYPNWDFPRLGGILGTYVSRWLGYAHGEARNISLFDDRTYWVARLRQQFISHQSIAGDRELLGDGTALRKWLAHPDDDEYWKAMRPTGRQYAAMRMPILTLCGQYDGDAPGALRYYAEHRRQLPQGRHDLVIGPWDHAGTREPKTRFNGLRFGTASRIDVRELLCKWYRWALGDGPRPEFLRDRTAVYVAGEERWHYAKSLEELGTPAARFFPSAESRDASRASRAGELAKRRPAAHLRNYSRDPLDTREGLVELANMGFSRVPETRAIRGTGLVFLSKPFPRGLRIVGRPRLSAWLRLDAPDADFALFFDEIRRDGREIHLTMMRLRARYRGGFKKPRLMKPGEWEPFEFHGHFYFARRLAKGSRLRMVLTTPVSPHLERNYNSGGLVAKESAANARSVHVEIALGGERAAILRFDSTPSAAG